jgi:hypothetical protein
LIDPTITIGNVIEIGTIVTGGFVTFALLRSTVIQLKAEVTELKTDVRELNKVVINMAVADRRIMAVEEDIRELRHGRGFVNTSIDGEWPRGGHGPA